MPENTIRLSSFLLSYRVSAQKAQKLLERREAQPSKALRYVSPNNIKLCAVQLRYKKYKNLARYVADMEELVAKAAKESCQLICFPEYTGLLLYTVIPFFRKISQRFLTLLQAGGDADCVRYLDALLGSFSSMVYEAYYRTFWLLAQKYGIYICAGSSYAVTEEGVFARTHLFGPGESFYQDKVHLAPFENRLGVCPGDSIAAVDTRIGRMVLLAGEDVLYYECCKAARAMDAQILLAPTAGLENIAYNTAHNAAWARTQEFPMYAVKASLVDEQNLPRVLRGSTGIYCPWYGSKNKDGVVASCNSETMQEMAIGRIDLEKLADMFDIYQGEGKPRLFEDMMKEYCEAAE